MSDSVVTLDVRDHLNSGREPFSLIMQTASALEKEQSLRLIVPFEPVPLYHIMAQRGFNYTATTLETGDWEILFSPCEGSSQDPATSPCTARSSTMLEVDARGLEPPEPLVRILEAIATLPADAELRARTDRRPVHLYPQLEERGFFGESTQQPDGTFVTLIRSRPVCK